MATPVILVTGHEGTAAVTADLLGLLTDHGTATLRSVAPGSVREPIPAHGVTAENNDDDTGHP